SELIGLGSYIHHYLIPYVGLRPGEVLPPNDPIPLGDYGTAGTPTMAGMMTYLETNWVPKLVSHDVGLTWEMDDTGIMVFFAANIDFQKPLQLSLDQQPADLGFALTSAADVVAAAHADISF